MADYGHVQAALESKEGAEQALRDFKAGVTVNPYGAYKETGWRRAAWESKMKALVNRRACMEAEHNRARCCWEHDWHLIPWNKSHLGITSCRFCEKEAALARAEIKNKQELAKDE